MPRQTVQRCSDGFNLLGPQLDVASFIENHSDWQVGHSVVVVIADVQISAVLAANFPNLFALNQLICVI